MTFSCFWKFSSQIYKFIQWMINLPFSIVVLIGLPYSQLHMLRKICITFDYHSHWLQLWSFLPVLQMLTLLRPDRPCICKQCRSRSSGETNWSGSVLFAIQYMNWCQQSGLSYLIGWKLITSGCGILIYSAWQGLIKIHERAGKILLLWKFWLIKHYWWCELEKMFLASGGFGFSFCTNC